MAGGCGCHSSGKSRQRQTMIRQDIEFFELVVPGEGSLRFDTVEEARARRTELGGAGQIRQRVESADVPAAYEVRLGDEVLLTTMKAPEAAAAALDCPGSKVWMVPSRPLVSS